MTLPMFRHRQQLRRWAARVLFLLLFGLGAGAANACLIGTPEPRALWAGEAQDPGQSAQHSARQDHHHGHAHAHHAHPVLPSDASDPPAPRASALCQDFCAKTALSILPLKSVLDDVHAPAWIATTAAIVLPLPTVARAPSWPPRQEGPPGPRISIAFLRLTL